MKENIYIAGPMRGYDGFNFPAFFHAETVLRERFPDANICNPAREDCLQFSISDTLIGDPTGLVAGKFLMDTPGLFTNESLRAAMGNDLGFITSTADLVVLLPGWQDSKGARAEVAAAQAVGVTVVELSEHDMFAELNRVVPDHDPSVETWADVFAVREHPAPEGWKCRNGHELSSGTSWCYVCSPAEPRVAEALAAIDAIPDLTGGEIRVVSETGGEKGSKLAAFDQVSPEVESLVAEHFGKGARKYSAHNFRKGYPWSLSYSALRRHLAAFWAGEEYDTCPEDSRGCKHVDGEQYEPGTCYNHTGSLHIVAVVWHAMTLTEFFLHRKEFDDRYVYDTA